MPYLAVVETEGHPNKHNSSALYLVAGSMVVLVFLAAAFIDCMKPVKLLDLDSINATISDIPTHLLLNGTYYSLSTVHGTPLERPELYSRPWWIQALWFCFVILYLAWSPVGAYFRLRYDVVKVWKFDKAAGEAVVEAVVEATAARAPAAAAPVAAATTPWEEAPLQHLHKIS